MPANGSSPSLGSLHARKAAAARWGGKNRDDVAREYATAKLEEYIKRTVDAAPPLTNEQRERLSALFRPNGGGNHAA